MWSKSPHPRTSRKTFDHQSPSSVFSGKALMVLYGPSGSSSSAAHVVEVLLYSFIKINTLHKSSSAPCFSARSFCRPFLPPLGSVRGSMSFSVCPSQSIAFVNKNQRYNSFSSLLASVKSAGAGQHIALVSRSVFRL